VVLFTFYRSQYMYAWIAALRTYSLRYTTRTSLARTQRAATSSPVTPDVKPFKELKVSVRVSGEGGEEFVCDEEPHFLKPELGFGFNPQMICLCSSMTRMHVQTFHAYARDDGGTPAYMGAGKWYL